MKVYQRPEFYVEEFVANEYVAACAWEPGTELTATCSGNNITIKLDTNQGGNVWSATPIDKNGNTAGGTEMLYPIKGTKDYAFCGAIYDGHDSSVFTGEYYPVSTAGGDWKVGDAYGQGELCSDVLDTQTSAEVGSWHHHLTNVKNKNNS